MSVIIDAKKVMWKFREGKITFNMLYWQKIKNLKYSKETEMGQGFQITPNIPPFPTFFQVLNT